MSVPHPRHVVITGSSGVGKSTLSQALQEALLPAQWLHFSADTLFYCLPRSVMARVDQHNDWAAVDSRTLVASAYACVQTLLGRGHDVVFDAVITSRTGEEALAAAFGDHRPLRVHLGCAWEEIERRTLARGDRTLAEARHGYENVVVPSGPHHHFDTTGRHAQEIAVELAQLLLSRPSSAA